MAGLRHTRILRAGSFRVKPGDKVKLGQVLAEVGNSGNSYSPHLHFQITDGPEFQGKLHRAEMPGGNWNISFPAAQ